MSSSADTLNNSLKTGSFKDSRRVLKLIRQINTLAPQVAQKSGRPVQVMEVCGGHTHAIYQSGLEQLLDRSVEFIHGPGCPVCVLPTEAIDQAIELAQKQEVIFTSFGDTLRVPGSKMSLQQAKALGADIRVLYSPFDAIELARAHPDKRIVFFAIGFDTTIPSIAQTIICAKKLGLFNLFFLCHHIRLMPVLYSLLERGEVSLDGFIGPGHVSIVTGSEAYHLIASKYHKPLVIAGFEPVDFLQALLQLLQQLQQGRCEIENAYSRVVTAAGNLQAQQAIETVFEEGINSHWRGMGQIASSGVALRADFQHFDACQFVDNKTASVDREPEFCGEVLRGVRKPAQCPNFNTRCTPASPKGALMVSSEGACAAYYKSPVKRDKFSTEQLVEVTNV